MTPHPYASVEDLPPKPDPVTGTPWPPEAPGRGKADRVLKEHDTDRESDRRQVPEPPAGQGPVLAWYRPSRIFKLKVGLGSVGLMAVGITLLQGFDVSWMGAWWMWLIVFAFSLLIVATLRGSACSVGADWLRRERGGFVRLYELTKITARWRSNAIHLDFEDQHGGKVQISSSDLREDPDVWDLVYNGILHSVIAGGAETNMRVHSAFQVPKPWPQQ